MALLVSLSAVGILFIVLDNGHLINGLTGMAVQGGSEDAIKYYAKMFEKYETKDLPIVTRYATKFPNETENIMKNLEELEQLKRPGFEQWQKEVITNPQKGLNYEVMANKLLKDKGYELLEFSRDGRIDTIFRTNVKKVAAEFKDGVDPTKYLSDPEYAKRLNNQLNYYKQFADSGNVDEAWIIYRGPMSQAYKSYAESLGIKVIEEGTLP